MIRPSYWTDADLQVRLTAEQREFYIGLWMLSDDAGIVDFDLDRIGAELYPYRPHRWRMAHIPKWIEVLAPHVRVMECGRHLTIPSLTRWQSPPKPSYQNQRAHDRCIRQMVPDGASGGHVVPAREGGYIGREGKGIEGGRRGATGLTPQEETTTLGAKIAAVAK